MEARLRSVDPYEVLLIAGLLRKLFLDDFPLVDQVNRQHRLKLSFEVVDSLVKPTAEDGNSLWSIQDGLDPDTAPPMKRRKSLSRDQFFHEIVAHVFGRQYSIREILLFEANVSGAVHAGAPKTDKERALAEVAGWLGIGGYPMALRQLQAVGRVALKALAPLRAAVEAE